MSKSILICRNSRTKTKVLRAHAKSQLNYRYLQTKLVFLMGKKKDFDGVFDILDKFGELSSGKINGAKSKAFHISNLRDSSNKYQEN